ncbi:MAG TPA: hypothetical protein VFS67_34125 [Polyangiaceae bacterium]|nr:hypothetical protein [Polyangiaceae bacterium]
MDGERPSGSPGADDGVLLEALPQRLVNCDALRDYTGARAEEILARAATGNPVAPLFEPESAAGAEPVAYAEWPEVARQPGQGRVAYARHPGSNADEFYLVANDAVPTISMSPSSIVGGMLAMPDALKQARGGAAPAYIFADGARVLIVGELDGAMLSAAGAATFFWALDLDANGSPQRQELQYVDARLIGARRSAGSVQVLLVASGSRLGLQSLPADPGTDPARLAEVRAGNRARIADATASDWLPRRVTADTSTGAALAGATVPAIECGDIYAPATPSGLQLLTLVELELAQGLSSWTASGLYTGNVQVSTGEDGQWGFVTEPWWSVSEDAARLAEQAAPETILHTFGTRARQLEPRGSIALRAAPQHDPALSQEGERWLLATHTGYGPALNGADQGQIWSFQPTPGTLALLARSPTFPLSPETQTEFAPGVAYVHTPGSDAASTLIDLSDPALELQEGPGADFRVLPWSNGQHLRVDLSQIRLLSGLTELTRYERGAEPSLESYTIPENGLFLDVPPANSWNRTLRVQRLAAVDPPETMGAVPIREGSLLPPLIENGVLLNAQFQARNGRAGGGSMGLETFDATTLSKMGSVSGSY